MKRNLRPAFQVVVSMLFALFFLFTTAQAQQPAAYGLFFYSPTCPHCHEVLNNHWDAIQAEFGDQLRVLFVNIAVPEGSQLMQIAVQTMNIPSNGVPMLIIGSEVLVGSIDIPMRTSQVVRAALAAGGTGFPPIPGVEALFNDVFDAQAAPSALTPALAATDPANIAAFIILIGLVVSLGVVLLAGGRAAALHNRGALAVLDGTAGRWVLLAAALTGAGLSLSVLSGGGEQIAVSLLAGMVALLFLALAVALIKTPMRHTLPTATILLVTIAGVLVAGYLTYVEVTLSDAVCGALAGCNTVQQSAYARIAGIPIGIIGMVGYGVVFALWLLKAVRPSPMADAGLLAAAVIGTVFSVYLTFLEPFVIGASCVWCLMSAVLMLSLLWLTAPAGWSALVGGQSAPIKVGRMTHA